MFDFLKPLDKKDDSTDIKESKFESSIQQVSDLSRTAKKHECINKVSERGKFLKLGSHRVTGKELNMASAHIDTSIIQLKNVQVETLQHIAQLYKALDTLDAEHIEGILTALKAAENATNWARVNDENIEKIITYLMQDKQMVAHRKAQEEKITVLANKVKTAYMVTGSAVVVALISLVLCLIALL